MHLLAQKALGLTRRLRDAFARWYYPRYVRRVVKECGPGLHVNAASTVLDGHAVRLGMNVHFNGMFIAGAGGVTIGNNFHSARNVRILSVNHDYDHGSAIPYGPEIVRRPVVIDDNVWLAEGVIVCPGARISEGVVAGAGAVIRGTVPPLAVVIGNPAQVVRYRDEQHYEELKRLGRVM